jgi:hypothetical protein
MGRITNRRVQMTSRNIIRIGLEGLVMGALICRGIGCSSSTSSDTPDTPGGNQQVFVSTTAQGHVHTVVIQMSEVEPPPQNGISRSTSSASGHTHVFTMTQQELQSVDDAMVVTVSDSVAAGHRHSYQIAKWF